MKKIVIIFASFLLIHLCFAGNKLKSATVAIEYNGPEDWQITYVRISIQLYDNRSDEAGHTNVFLGKLSNLNFNNPINIDTLEEKGLENFINGGGLLRFKLTKTNQAGGVNRYDSVLHYARMVKLNMVFNDGQVKTVLWQGISGQDGVYYGYNPFTQTHDLLFSSDFKYTNTETRSYWYYVKGDVTITCGLKGKSSSTAYTYAVYNGAYFKNASDPVKSLMLFYNSENTHGKTVNTAFKTNTPYTETLLPPNQKFHVVYTDFINNDGGVLVISIPPQSTDEWQIVNAKLHLYFTDIFRSSAGESLFESSIEWNQPTEIKRGEPAVLYFDKDFKPAPIPKNFNGFLHK